MKIESWLIIVATLLGPILAVQAQKWLERFRERSLRKQAVFHSLMATRAARLSTEHVQSLNMIDIVFYGQGRWPRRRTKTEQAVIDSWKEYHDHLNTGYSEENATLWFTRGDELFINLLHAMSQDVGFAFDRVQLKKGSYSPVAHGELENQQNMVRELLIDLLKGDLPLKMEVTSFPMNQEAIDAQVGLQKEMRAVFGGEIPLNVTIKKEDPAE